MNQKTGGTFAAALVRFYQLFISCLKPSCCRFYPTCSEYSRQAFLKFGLIRGLLLTIWRLLRCQPFYRGAYYDPVPDRFPLFNRQKQKGIPLDVPDHREENH